MRRWFPAHRSTRRGRRSGSPDSPVQRRIRPTTTSPSGAGAPRLGQPPSSPSLAVDTSRGAATPSGACGSCGLYQFVQAAVNTLPALSPISAGQSASGVAAAYHSWRAAAPMSSSSIRDRVSPAAPRGTAADARRPVVLGTLSVRVDPTAEEMAFASALEAGAPLIVVN